MVAARSFLLARGLTRFTSRRGIASLSEAQVQKYHEHGFVVPDYRLSNATLESIRELHTSLVDRHPEFRDYCSALLPVEPRFLEFALDPNILAMVEQLVGPDIALWNSSFFAKPAHTGRKTPWHQDGRYWPIRPVATTTVWIAIDDATSENGCLRLAPGSHSSKELMSHHERVGMQSELTLPLELDASFYSEEEAVDLVLEAGQMSLHDVFLAHMSEPNRSMFPRRGLTMRFMPTSSLYDRKLPLEPGSEVSKHFAELPVFLMRGKDAHGGNDLLSPSDATPRQFRNAPSF